MGVGVGARSMLPGDTAYNVAGFLCKKKARFLVSYQHKDVIMVDDLLDRMF